MICKKCKKQIEEDSIYCRFCGKKQIESEKPRKRQKRPDGSGTVYKLSGNRSKPYYARVSINGKNVCIGTYTTRTEALVALESVRVNGISNIYNATVEDVYNMLVSQKEDKVSQSALTLYGTCFAHLAPISKMKMNNIIKIIRIQSKILNLVPLL